jgi:SagB-type dehydrogenase family enzyme
MKKNIFFKAIFMLILFCGIGVNSFSQKMDTIRLVKPDTTGGKPLMQALKERKTNRDIQEGSLTDQQLSNLLWAACGVNRPDGKRTAPSAMNKQEIDVYVALKKGLYLYDASKHILIPVLSEDVRSKMAKQSFAGDAAAMLVYVADYDKMSDSESKDNQFYSGTDAGFISQNVYLYCASENLATVVLGWIDRDSMNTVMKLKPNQKIVLSQCIGIPAK